MRVRERGREGERERESKPTTQPQSLSKLQPLSLFYPNPFPTAVVSIASRRKKLTWVAGKLTTMDVDSWASKVQAAKNLSAAHAARLHYDNHMASEDSEGDDDAKSCFPCPFCYVDIEVPMLCSHLEEEHFFDLKNAVCPLCAASLGKDVIGHFMVHHASSFKSRRKSQKSGLWTGSSATLGKALLKNGRAYAHESAPDPLLSTFICNVPFSDPTDIPQDVCSDSNSPISSGMKRAEPTSEDEGCEQDKEERRQRAAFVQELIRSTIFLDL